MNAIPSNKVALAVVMRQNSTRFPDKMLQRLGTRTIAEVAFDTLMRAGQLCDSPSFAVLYPHDQELIGIANQVGISIKLANPANDGGETYEAVYRGHDSLFADFDQVVHANACMPFLKPETICQSMWEAARLGGNGTSVFRYRGLVWNDKRQLVIGDDSLTPNTKTNPEYYIPAHAIFWFPTHILGTSEMAQLEHLMVLEPGAEFMDIDTFEDYQQACDFHSRQVNLSNRPQASSKSRTAGVVGLPILFANQIWRQF